MLYLAQAEPGADSSDAAVADALAKVKGWKEFSAGFGGTARLAPRRAFKDSPGLDQLIDKASRNAQSMGVRGYRPLDYKRYFLLSVPSSAGASSADTYCELKAGLQRIGGRVFLSMPTRRAAATKRLPGLGAGRRGHWCQPAGQQHECARRWRRAVAGGRREGMADTKR